MPPASRAPSASTRLRIQGCFPTRVAVGEPAPGMQVDFAIGPNGQLKRAAVTPAGVAGRPLGGCIATIARGTRFPGQGEQLSFTIPVTTRRVAAP